MKKWYQSKTIWLGIGAVVTAVVSSLQASPDWKTAVIAGLGAGGILLRALTTEGIIK